MGQESDTYSNIKKHLLQSGQKPDQDSESKPLLDRRYLLDPTDGIHLMLGLCSLIYTLAQLRQLAREYNLTGDHKKSKDDDAKERFLEGDYNYIAVDNKVPPTPSELPRRPISPRTLENIITNDLYDGLFERACASELTVHTIQMLKSVERNSRTTFLNNFDAAYKDLELVYGICAILPREKKNVPAQIALVFRGSVEPNDWAHNLRFSLAEIRVSVGEESAYLVEGITYQTIQIDLQVGKQLKKILKSEPIRVHRGFLQYLFAKQQGASKTKYQAIADNLLWLLRHPKFERNKELTVTGHSLGGALATLTSFLLSCDLLVSLEIHSSKGRKSVLCTSFAAPIVGDQTFQIAYNVMQTKFGKDQKDKVINHERLQHVRITNDRDLVPLSPPLPSYRHTGLHVHLRKGKFYGTRPPCIIEPTPFKEAGWGLWVTCLPFAGCLFTTVPIAYYPIYAILRSLTMGLLPLHWISGMTERNSSFSRMETKGGLILVWCQLAMLVARRPWQVLRFKTHGLEDYFFNLRDYPKTNSLVEENLRKGQQS